jgi:hypothetical protein
MANKAQELAMVEAIRSRMPGFPAGPLEAHEAPDVLLRHSERVIGFEVTNLYPLHAAGTIPVQAQEAERRGIVNRASAMAEARGVPPVLVGVLFNDSISIQKSERDYLARAIAEVVESHYPKDFGIVSIKNEYFRGVPLPRQVERIGIHRQPGITQHSWSQPEADIVTEEFYEVIQDAIDAKSSEVSRYLAQCTECHLIIASGVETFRPAYEASVTTLAHEYRSRFSRTFYLEAFGMHRQFELKTKNSESDNIA